MKTKAKVTLTLQKTMLTSGAPKDQPTPAPIVTPVVLLEFA